MAARPVRAGKYDHSHAPVDCLYWDHITVSREADNHGPVKCCYCGKDFPDPVWPNTQQVVCSRACTVAASYRRHRETKLDRQKQYRKEHPEKVLISKRKYNHSDKGKLAQARYQNTHDDVSAYLLRYKSDPHVRAIQLSRQASRKLLLKSRPRQCEECGRTGSGRQVQCHHKDGNPLNRDISNLEWLCIPCHSNRHSECVFIE